MSILPNIPEPKKISPPAKTVTPRETEEQRKTLKRHRASLATQRNIMEPLIKTKQLGA